jgi:hypothetical protein
LESAIYRACDSAQLRNVLLNRLCAGGQCSVEEVELSIARLCESKVLLSLNGKVLALAINSGAPETWKLAASHQEGLFPDSFSVT